MSSTWRVALGFFSILVVAAGAATAAPIGYSFGPIAFGALGPGPDFLPQGTGSVSGSLDFDPMSGLYSNVAFTATGTTGHDGVYSVIDGIPDKQNLSLFQVGGGGVGSSVLVLEFSTPTVFGGGLGDTGAGGELPRAVASMGICGDFFGNPCGLVGFNHLSSSAEASISPAPTPVPATLPLLAGALVAFGLAGRSGRAKR